MPAGQSNAGQLGHELALLLPRPGPEALPLRREGADQVRALRWLGRDVTKGKAVSLLKAQLAVVALAELRAGEREAAATLLTELVR
jgi:hypothetical protein